MVTVRRATLDDVAQLAHFRVLLFQSENELMEAEEAASAYQMFAASLKTAMTEGEHFAWLAELNGVPIGCGGANFFKKLPTPANPSGRSVYILNMFTLPEYRGRGAAAMIIENIKEFAKAQGVKRVFLDSSGYGRPIYKKIGFWEQKDVAMEIFV